MQSMLQFSWPQTERSINVTEKCTLKTHVLVEDLIVHVTLFCTILNSITAYDSRTKGIDLLKITLTPERTS